MKNNSRNLRRALSYCAKNIRSKSEVIAKIKSWNIELEEEEFILDFLEKNSFLFSDDLYLDKYLENISSVKGYSKLQLKIKLLRKHIPSSLINDKLNNYYRENEDLELSKFIKKNHKKIISKPRESAIKYLLSKGFKYNLVLARLKNLNL